MKMQKRWIGLALALLLTLMAVWTVSAMADGDGFQIVGGVLTKYNPDEYDSETYGGDSAHPVIPETVKVIGASAFKGTDIAEIVIPDQVNSIQYSAFAECRSLQKVTLPSKLTTISKRVFQNDTSLTNIVIPDTVTGFFLIVTVAALLTSLEPTFVAL